MGIGSVGANLANSLLGNATKAALLVRRINPSNLAQKLVNEAISTVQNTLYAGVDAAGTAGDLMGALASSSGARRGKDLINFVKYKSDWDYFEFQYNPETINLSSQVGSCVVKQGPPESGLNQLARANHPAQTRMRFRMHFCDINNANAFMQDKLIVAPSAIVKDIAGLICTYSVQTPVEGLVSLITQYATRQAIFVFGDVVFFGEIESVNAQYTMFSPDGNPIAATVEMSIFQKTAPVVKDETGAEVVNMGGDYWDEAFTKLFGPPGESKTIDMGSFADLAGSLVNLNA